jgi:hypothetical protein
MSNWEPKKAPFQDYMTGFRVFSSNAWRYRLWDFLYGNRFAAWKLFEQVKRQRCEIARLDKKLYTALVIAADAAEDFKHVNQRLNLPIPPGTDDLNWPTPEESGPSTAPSDERSEESSGADGKASEQ